ncbi:MAG: hypothetical protein IPN17_31570 [Deltaproteobacteria bacterium]|nr:hypothetical protein [Deltaproteobacteria bacterium]
MAQSNESTLIEQCGGGCGAGITAEQRALVRRWKHPGDRHQRAVDLGWCARRGGAGDLPGGGGRSDEVFTPTLAVGLGTVSLRGRF